MIPVPDFSSSGSTHQCNRGRSVFWFLTYDSFTNCRENFQLGRFAFAAGVSTRTIDIRRLFHSLALRAAVFAGRCCAGTDGVRAFLAFRSSHFFIPLVS